MITLKNITDKKVYLPCLKCISIGRAYELLRDDVRKHLTKARKEIGFEYCRFHALFHDDMDVVYKKVDGSIGYHWHHIDKIYDFLLSIGMKPFVELNPMPSAIASGDETFMWYKMNITPPSKMELWYDLVYSFTKHVADRYGNDEVSTWFFEVWNEPNLACFWTGSQEEYLELYKSSANAIKAVCPDFKVGGPATAVAAWIQDTIDYCAANNVALDFISTHLYPHDEYCRYKNRDESPYEIGQYYSDVVKSVQDTVKNSVMPDLKIYWTEFNTQSADCAENIQFLGNTSLDRLFGASCVVRNMIAVKDYCEAVSYWVISDIFEEAQMPHLPFSGTYGLLNIHGIKKAAYNAFVLLKKMRGRIIDVDLTAPLGCGVLAAEENGTYRILLWNNVLPEIKDQPVWSDKIQLNISDTDDYIIQQARIREGQGSPYEAWLKMGKPSNLSPFEEEFLRARGEMEYSLATFNADAASIDVSLKPDEVLYLEIKKNTDLDVSPTVDMDLQEKLRTY